MKREMKEKKREIPEKPVIEFVVADEEVNRKGWRLLLSGLDLVNFEKNPVALVQHDTWSVPIGRWENLRVDGGRLLGSLVFDRRDEEAMRLFWKYKDGYMNAVSIHVRPIEESEDQALLLPGQTYPTITKSELLEISVVTLPGNANAVKLLNTDGTEYQLNLIQRQMEEKKKSPEMDDQTKLDAMRQEIAEMREVNAKNLVALHVQRGVVDADEVEHLHALAKLDYHTTEKMLEARKVKETPVADPHKGKGAEEAMLAEQLDRMLSGDAKPADEREGWSYLDWYKRDHAGLLSMQEKDSARYAALVSAWEQECKSKGLNLE